MASNRSLILIQMGALARLGSHGYVAALASDSCAPEVERDALNMLARQSHEMAALCECYAEAVGEEEG